MKHWIEGVVFWAVYALILGAVFYGCTDAEMANYESLSQRHHVKCWSGGTVIYDGHSTGVIKNEEHSDGYFFKDESTGKVVHVSGNCVLTIE